MTREVRVGRDLRYIRDVSRSLVIRHQLMLLVCIVVKLITVIVTGLDIR